MSITFHKLVKASIVAYQRLLVNTLAHRNAEIKSCPVGAPTADDFTV
ncbi:MAG: hypothetical protein LBU65_00530 [Planctomycetaceae bacterium]|nr:hypothetical protein [Planctomycetaceae bacterium]